MIKNDILIKFVPTFLEVLALFYFAEHFLTAKVSRIRRYIANICFYLLDFCTIYYFQEKPSMKYAIVILLIFLWGRYIYQVPIINGIFLSIFQFSYWAIMDLQWDLSFYISIFILGYHGFTIYFYCIIFVGREKQTTGKFQFAVYAY